MLKNTGRKRYNTETSTLLAISKHGETSDPSHYTEKLYRKRNGEFFLYGEGGATSKYAEKTSQNKWQSGKQIIPLSVDIAREWAKKHMESKKYEEVFESKIKESNTTKTWTLHVSPATIERVRQLAGYESLTLSEVVEKSVLAYYKCSTQSTRHTHVRPKLKFVKKHSSTLQLRSRTGSTAGGS